MKFKVGDKVMLKAVPHDDFTSVNIARAYYDMNVKRIYKVTSILVKGCTLDNFYPISAKYLKHAVKPKKVKYTVDCKGMSCFSCHFHKNDSICKFTGNKKDVKEHINIYWKQPKIKAVK